MHTAKTQSPKQHDTLSLICIGACSACFSMGVKSDFLNKSIKTAKVAIPVKIVGTAITEIY